MTERVIATIASPRHTAKPSVFADEEIDSLPEPVKRYLLAAIAPGTPVTSWAQLYMRGRIKAGWWLPFSAHQILNPHKGFVWTARAAGVITATDRYQHGAGATNVALAGLTLARAEGADVSRSAAGRACAEAIWVPTALLPRYGVNWTVIDDTHIIAHQVLGRVPVELHLHLDGQSRIRSLVFDRWGDPHKTGTWDWYPFGGGITGYRSFGGLTIPCSGSLGWHYGNDRWKGGEFFRYNITSLQQLPG